MRKNIIQKLTKFAFIVLILIVPFSFVYSPAFLENNKSYTSFPLYNIYLIDVAAVFLIFTILLSQYLHKKSFFAFFSNGNNYSRALAKNHDERQPKRIAPYVPTRLISFVSFAFLSFLWSGSPFLSAFWGFRLPILATAVYLSLALVLDSVYYKNIFFKLIIATGLIESLIALGQFIFQQSLGLYFLGEGNLNGGILGLAKIDLFGHNLLRAYGTFPHPNVLGGFLLFTIVTTFWYKPARYQNIFIFIQFIGLGLTFSRSAILGFLLIILLSWRAWKFFPAHNKYKSILNKKTFLFSSFLILLFSLFLIRSPIQKILDGSDQTTRLRIEYVKAAFSRFSDSPILGRGWGTGPIELPAFSKFPFYSWEMQPVHNIYLLVLSDLGIIGLLLFLYLIYRILNPRHNQYPMLSFSGLTRESKKNFKEFPKSLISLRPSGMTKESNNNMLWKYLFITYLFIGFFDHYLLTIPQGIFIFFAAALLFSAASTQKREKTPPQE